MDNIVKYENQFNSSVVLHDFTAGELNLLMTLSHRVREHGSESIVLTFEELKKYIEYRHGYTVRDFAERIMQTNRKLLKLNFIYKDEETKRTVQFVLFSTFVTDPENQTLTIAVNPQFVFLFNDLSSHFTRFELQEFVSLNSRYSKECYRRLKQFRTTGIWSVSIRDFRNYLDVPEKYSMTDINKRVLTPVMNELNSVFRNLRLEKVRARRTGSPVERLVFMFEPEPRSGCTAGGSCKKQAGKDVITHSSAAGIYKAGQFRLPETADCRSSCRDSFKGTEAGSTERILPGKDISGAKVPSSLRSRYSKGCYRMLDRVRENGVLDITVGEFRECLNIPESYDMRKISSKVLNPVMRELTDEFKSLRIEKVRAHRRGAAVERLIFTFESEGSEELKPVVPQPADREGEILIPCGRNGNIFLTRRQYDVFLHRCSGFGVQAQERLDHYSDSFLKKNYPKKNHSSIINRWLDEDAEEIQKKAVIQGSIYANHINAMIMNMGHEYVQAYEKMSDYEKSIVPLEWIRKARSKESDYPYKFNVYFSAVRKAFISGVSITKVLEEQKL